MVEGTLGRCCDGIGEGRVEQNKMTAKKRGPLPIFISFMLGHYLYTRSNGNENEAKQSEA